MADTKISALTAATTPLAGTEVLPIVQSGVTKKVAVSDLTAGRAVSVGSVSVGTTQIITTGGMWYQTSGGLLVMSPATTGGFAWNNYANNAQIASLSNGGALTIKDNFLLDGAGNPTHTVKTSGAGNNPLYRLQADTNYWDMIGVFSDATDNLRFRYNNSDFLTIFSTGGTSIGNTIDPGAGNLSVTGRTFSKIGTDNINNGATVTLFTLGTGDVYIVNASFANFSGGTTTAIVWLPKSGNTGYSGAAILGQNNANFTLSVNGANVQLTSTIGATATYYWSAIKLY